MESEFNSILLTLFIILGSLSFFQLIYKKKTSVLAFSFSLICLYPVFRELNSRPTMHDWSNILWYISLKSNFSLDFFVDLNPRVSGYFYPLYYYYGGEFFNLIAGLRELTRATSLQIYLVFQLIGIGLWGLSGFIIAKIHSLSNKYAFLFSLLTATCPYMLTNLFGRSAFLEYTGTAISFLFLSTIFYVLYSESILLGTRKLKVQLAFFVLFYLLATIHQITFILTIQYVSAFLLINFVCFNLFSNFTTLDLLRTYVLKFRLFLVPTVTAVMFSVIQVFPSIHYGSRLLSAQGSWSTQGQLFFSSYDLIFSLGRKAAVGSGTPNLYTQIPILVIGLGILVLMMIVLNGNIKIDNIYAVNLIAHFVLFVILLYVLNSAEIFQHYFPLRVIEFPYRLINYLTVSLIIMLALIINIAIISKTGFKPLIYFALFFITTISLKEGVNQAQSSFSHQVTSSEISNIQNGIQPRLYYHPAMYSIVGNIAEGIPEYKIIKISEKQLILRIVCKDGRAILPTMADSWVVDVQSENRELGFTSNGWRVLECKDMNSDVIMSAGDTSTLKILKIIKTVGLIWFILYLFIGKYSMSRKF
jgi:hypothetical protein